MNLCAFCPPPFCIFHKSFDGMYYEQKFLSGMKRNDISIYNSFTSVTRHDVTLNFDAYILAEKCFLLISLDSYISTKIFKDTINIHSHPYFYQDNNSLCQISVPNKLCLSWWFQSSATVFEIILHLRVQFISYFDPWIKNLYENFSSLDL